MTEIIIGVVSLVLFAMICVCTLYLIGTQIIKRQKKLIEEKKTWSYKKTKINKAKDDKQK